MTTLNPYAGGEYETDWQSGYDAGITSPAGPPEPPGVLVDESARVVWSEGALAGYEEGLREGFREAEPPEPDEGSEEPDQNFPRSEDEWFMAGVIYGWTTGVSTPEAPAPLDDAFLSAYMRGAKAGCEARLADDGSGEPATGDDHQGPAIDVAPDEFIPLEKALREQREILESIFHRHMPDAPEPEYEQWYPPFGEMTIRPPD